MNQRNYEAEGRRAHEEGRPADSAWGALYKEKFDRDNLRPSAAPQFDASAPPAPTGGEGLIAIIAVMLPILLPAGYAAKQLGEALTREPNLSDGAALTITFGAFFFGCFMIVSLLATLHPLVWAVLGAMVAMVAGWLQWPIAEFRPTHMAASLVGLAVLGGGWMGGLALACRAFAPGLGFASLAQHSAVTRFLANAAHLAALLLIFTTVNAMRLSFEMMVAIPLVAAVLVTLSGASFMRLYLVGRRWGAIITLLPALWAGVALAAVTGLGLAFHLATEQGLMEAMPDAQVPRLLMNCAVGSAVLVAAATLLGMLVTRRPRGGTAEPA